MDSQFTVIPFKQRDEILDRLRHVQATLDHDNQSLMRLDVEYIIFKLETWTDWDDEIRTIVGRAEEEQRQAPTQEVSGISAASV